LKGNFFFHFLQILIRAYAKLTARFFDLFEQNILSIKNANAKELGSIDFAHHYITRRYAECLVSVLVLTVTSEDMGDIGFVKKVNTNLSRLREEMEKLLIRLADSKFRDWKSKTIFLMNNYDLILGLLQRKGLSSVDSLQFQKLLDLRSADFVREEFEASFGKLVNFAKNNSAKVAENLPENTKLNIKEGKIFWKNISRKKTEDVEVLLKEFQHNWKPEVERIHLAWSKQFSNYELAMRFFSKLMQDLLDAYTVLVAIIKKYFKNLRTSKFFVPETEVSFEMKRTFNIV
jgi:hypothetical protein